MSLVSAWARPMAHECLYVAGGGAGNSGLHLRCHGTLADPEADQPVDTEIQN